MSIPTVEKYISDVVGKSLISVSNTTRGINGFLFDINTQDEVTVENEVTNHYVEANYAIQDHVAHKPKIITLKGFIAELKDEYVNAGMNLLTNVQSLGDIGGLAPNLAQQAAQVYSKIENVVSKVNSYINQANNISSIFNDKSTSKTAQQKAYDQLSSFADGNVLCTVQTPFGIFKNMLIIRLGNIQRDDTNMMSDFNVMLQEIRVAESLTVNPQVFSGRTADAISLPKKAGQVVGQPVVTVTTYDENWGVIL